MKLCFATRNRHKIEEISAVLPKTWEVLSLDDIGCDEELPETHPTIEANSAQKAQYVWDNFGVSCFADDSGLEVFALGGEPGVHSAYYSGSRDFDANITHLLSKLEDKEDKTAQFKTIITLVLNGEYHQFEGIARGSIITEKRGNQGFGYDPIFIPEGNSLTFGQLPISEKNKISARGIAVQKLVDFLAKITL
jgi:XTP/dITP diphosphohydrolase